MEPCPKLHQGNAISGCDREARGGNEPVAGKAGGLTRRRFLFLGAAAGIALAVSPAVELVGTLKTEVMGPFGWPEYWYRQELYGRIVITGPELAATREQAGSFLSARTRAYQEMAAAIQRDEELRILHQGRRVLRC